MKTHIPTKLRKALIAALFAVSSVAYNAQAEYNDDHDVGSNATNVITDTYLGADAVGYFDFEFYSGTSVLGKTHYTHSLLGGDYYTRAVATLGPSGKFEFNTLEAYLGCDPDYDIDTGSYIGGEGMGYYSTTWSNGNISVNDAVLEVTKTITANGSLSVNSGSRVTAGNSISAGGITINRAQMTADTITAVQGHTQWNPQADDTYTTGLFRLSDGAVVTANKEIRAQELLVNSSTVNASNITVKDAISGSQGIIKGLPDSDLTVSGKILTENAKYVASSGYAVKVENIGDIYNAGTVDVPIWKVRGNYNHFGYNEDGTSVLPSRVEVKGNVVSDGNKIAATGSNLVAGTPAISITGTVGRTDGATGPAIGNELYAMKGDITVGTLADNTKLTILAEDGGVEIKNASTATVKDSSITAADDVVIAAAETDSNKQLNLINTDVTSEDGDITANQVLVMEKGTLSAENGDVTAVGLNGKAASVHAINLEAGNIKLDANGSTTADVVLTGDMTSTEESILIKGYNGEKPRVTVDGNMTAQQALDIMGSNVSVGKDQKSVASGISVSESTLAVGGDQTAGTSMAIDSGSKVTVGHEDEETGELVGGNQTAKMNITIEDSDVTVLADQTSTDGSIVIRDLDDSQHPTIVKVEGNQKAKTGISATKAGLTVGIIEEIEDELTGEKTYELSGGNQTAETGDISLSNAKVAILGHQDATEGNISVTDGTTLKVGAVAEDGEIVQESNQTAKGNITISDSDVTVLGDQTSTEGSIVITDLDATKNPTKVAVNGNQTAKGSISATKAELAVGIIEEIEDEETGEITYELHGGNQTAETGDISLSNAKVAILGHQDATEGNISVTGGTTLKVGAVTEDGEIVQESNQTAKKNITITDSDVTVLGDQTATTGKIAISVTDPELNSATVTVDGNQLAGNGISVDDSTLTVGTIEETTTPWGWPVYTLHGGNQTAKTGDITISHSDVNVLGDQTAETGAISVTKGSDLTVGCLDPNGFLLHAGNQTADTDITISDSLVHVLGDQTATTGKIAISVTDSELYSATVTVDGNQLAGNGISVDDSMLTVGVVREFTDMWGNTHYWLNGGNQTAQTGDINIANSMVDILGNQEATAGSIGVFNSELMVGAVDPNGEVLQASNQTAYQNIEIVDSYVNVLGNQIAEQGRIAIQSTGIEGTTPSEVIIGGEQTAHTDIIVADSTLTVGTIETIEDEATGEITYELHGGNQTAETGDISLSNAKVAILGHQDATEGNISVTGGTSLKVGAMTEDGEIVQASNQTAKQNIEIVDSYVNVLGDQTAETGAIAISSIPETGITSLVSVGGNQKAGNGIFVTASELTVGTAELVTDETTGEKHVVLTGGNQTALNDDIVISNSTVEVLGDQTAVEGGIKIDKLSLVAVGTIDTDGQAVAGNQLAKQDIEIDSSTLMVMENQTSQEGSINVQTSDDFSLVIVGGTQTAKKNISIFGSKEYEEPTTVMVGEDQIAQEGNIAINDAQVYVQGKVVALGDGTDGTGIVALAGASYDVDISLQAKELNIGTIDNPSAVTINVDSLDADGNPLDTVLDVDKLTVAEGNTLHTGNVKMDATDVSIAGAVEVGVKDEDPEKAIAANWDTEGSHLISGEGASLKANGNIRIASAAEGDTTAINNGATVAATGNVTIQGLAAALAEVDNAKVHANGDITLDRAELMNNQNADITTKGGNIVLKNRVEISDTVLNVLAPEGAEPGVVNVTEDADVQLYQGTFDVFNGKLAGSGSVAANDENLLLYQDASAFNGKINMNRGEDQTLLITNGTGVGANATLALHNGADLETINTTGEMQQPQLGNVVATGAGSDITLNGGVAGDTARATSLSLTDGTTLNVDSTQGEAGLVADSIVGTQKIDAQGARVAVHSTTDMEITPDGTRHTVVGLAEGGTIASGFNEDVLYDLNGVQRTLQTRNMRLEHTAHGVDLVLSENYKGIDNRNTNAVAVRDVILPLDAAADHRPGVLAGSASELDHVLDALDYTRSGADAREGLLSLSGAANLIVPNMMMDASRHHLSDLRDHMSAPVCTDNRKTKGNVWAAYTGGYDHIGGDENMHAYSHSYQGALVGGDYAVNCNWAVGLSLGYQKSIARTDGTRADADAISGDLYAVGRTGKYTHRFSMGLTSYSTDVKRGTRIAAAGHTYHGQSTGSADGMSWNFGYQLSRNFAINEVSSITPYLAVDVALQRIDTLNEKGQGDASLVTDYEDFVQTDAALGVAYSHTFTSFNRQTGVFSVNLAAHGEFSEHRATAKNHFAGYADTWKTRSMKRAPFYGELGADVVVPFGEHLSGTAGMNFEFSADRTFVGGHAGVNYRF